MPRFSSTKTSLCFLKKDGSFRWLSLLDSSLRSVAIAMIGSYQRHLSPRKGYSCAHRVVYSGDSCSEYVKQTLADKSLFETTLLARQRFKACNIAYTSSKSRVFESKGSAKVSVDLNGECIIGIVVAILAAICGGGKCK